LEFLGLGERVGKSLGKALKGCSCYNS
jgi:hypothetical protein